MIKMDITKMSLRSRPHSRYPVIILTSIGTSDFTSDYREHDRLIPISVKLPASMLNKIHMICNKNGIRRSTLIRQAINEFLKKYGV